MPDFEDASPAHFLPDGAPKDQPVGVFAALRNAKDIFEGRLTNRAYEAIKKVSRGRTRSKGGERVPGMIAIAAVDQDVVEARGMPGGRTNRVGHCAGGAARARVRARPGPGSHARVTRAAAAKHER